MEIFKVRTFLVIAIFSASLSSCGNDGATELRSEVPPTEISTGSTAVSTGKVSEPEKPLPIRTIAKEGFNVFLYENGKKIAQLTQKGNAKDIDINLCKDDNPEQHVIAYELLSDSGKFGVVHKEDYTCGMPTGSSVFYAMSLTNGSMELSDVSKYVPSFDSYSNQTTRMNGEKDAIVVSFDSNNVVSALEEMEMGTVLLSDLKKEWFVKSGQFWIKTVELGRILENGNGTSATVPPLFAKTQTVAPKRYTVIAEKTYFFNGAGTDQRKSYVVLGDAVSVGEIRDGFGFSEYVNSKGVKTSGFLKMSDLAEGEKKIVANTIPPALSGKYEISKKSEYGSELSATVEIDASKKGKYNVRWTMNEYGYQEDNPSTSRSNAGAWILKMDGPTSWTLSLVETWEETDDAIDSSAMGCGSLKAVFRNGSISLEEWRATCGFVKGVYQKR